MAGTEIFLSADPGFTAFTSLHTIRIPGLQVAEYVLILDNVTTVMTPLGDGVYMCGTTTLLSPDGMEIIGSGSWVARTHPVGPAVPGALTVDVSLVGTIWSGPLGGLVITENISGGVISPAYEAQVDGFLMVPAFVDAKALKAAMAE